MSFTFNNKNSINELSPENGKWKMFWAIGPFYNIHQDSDISVQDFKYEESRKSWASILFGLDRP